MFSGKELLSMKVFGIAKGFHGLWKINIQTELSEKERNRLRAITLWQRSRDIRLACETFGVGMATLYRWIRQDMSSLKEKSRRPIG